MNNVIFFNKFINIIKKNKNIFFLISLIINFIIYNKLNKLFCILFTISAVILNTFVILKLINKKNIILIINEAYYEIKKIFFPKYYKILYSSFIITFAIIIFSLILFFLDNIISYSINSLINM